MMTTLINKRFIDPSYTLYTMGCKTIASAAKAGQFVQVRVSKGSHPAMRKPLSVFCVEGDTFGLLVKSVGYGAELMKRWEIGEDADIIGPLGQGYHYEEENNDFILVAGGVGLAPINFLAQKLAGEGKNVHLLFVPKRDLILMDACAMKTGIDIRYSDNRHTVADDLKRIITSIKNPCGVFTCGPNELMKLVADAAHSFGLSTQVSLETRMSCGMGVCLGCAVPVRSGDDWAYKTVCRDGPVFRAEEVILV